MNNKIALVIPYFGVFPNYFNLWLQSARKNKKFDFLIFTDNSMYKTVDNIKFIDMTFDRFKQILQNKVEFKICLNDPYKICDYRPMFGEALHKYLKKYIFWGFCDVDLIFGKLSNFITPEILNNYEKNCQLGHFTLLKNNEKCNSLWKIKHHIPSAYRYDEAFKTPYPCHFDETDGLTQISKSVGIKTYNKMNFADIDRKKLNFYPLDYKINECANLFYWNKGNLEYFYLEANKIKKIDFAYAHFQKRKMEISFNLRNSNISSYVIVPNKFVKTNDPIKFLKDQKVISKYPYYRISRQKEIIKKIKKHAIQQRIYRLVFRRFNRYFLDAK